MKFRIGDKVQFKEKFDGMNFEVVQEEVFENRVVYSVYSEAKHITVHARPEELRKWWWPR